MTQTPPLVILDRDGVINEDSPDYIRTVAQWQPIPGSLEAIVRLNRAGFRVAVASNQSAIGRGLIDVATLEAIHTQMQHRLAQLGGRIDAIFYCPHHPDDHCDCRKPKPGLYQAIGRHFGCTLEGVPIVGDSLRDLQAALAVNGLPVLVLTGNGSATRALLKRDIGNDKLLIYADLAAFVQDWLNQPRTDNPHASQR